MDPSRGLRDAHKKEGSVTCWLDYRMGKPACGTEVRAAPPNPSVTLGLSTQPPGELPVGKQSALSLHHGQALLRPGLSNGPSVPGLYGEDRWQARKIPILSLSWPWHSSPVGGGACPQTPSMDTCPWSYMWVKTVLSLQVPQQGLGSAALSSLHKWTLPAPRIYLWANSRPNRWK